MLHRSKPVDALALSHPKEFAEHPLAGKRGYRPAGSGQSGREWRPEGMSEGMVEVEIDSIRVSLMSQHRIVILKDVDSERFLPIWIGPYEAEAITVSLQETEVLRPLTHDLLRNVLQTLGAEVLRINITELRDDVFYARIILRVDGREIEVDSRPSDALALSVRVHVPVFVAESVMEEASTEPESDIEAEEAEEPTDERLEVFKDFIDSIDLDGMESDSGDSDD
jgi:bifunctional DNase/RNase